MLATFLASSLARAGRRTLLIDADLRRPSIHELLALPASPGLCEVLGGEVSADEAVQPEAVTGLYVLPAGCWGPQMQQMLAQQGPRDLFEQLLVDSSPVLPVADALLLAPHADAVLLSIRFPVSRIPQVYAAYERLRAVQARVLGTVVQGASGEFHGYEYRYAMRSAYPVEEGGE
jgi:Mrp family chromosome partitioning ATPase